MFNYTFFKDTKKKQTEFYLNKECVTTKTIGKIIVTQKRNNYTFCITDSNNNVIFTQTPGILGFKKSNRKNIITYKEVVFAVSKIIKKNTSLNYFQLIFKGICKGRKIILSSFLYNNITIISLISTISFPKNGCKRKKQRRI